MTQRHTRSAGRERTRRAATPRGRRESSRTRRTNGTITHPQFLTPAQSTTVSVAARSPPSRQRHRLRREPLNVVGSRVTSRCVFAAAPPGMDRPSVPPPMALRRIQRMSQAMMPRNQAGARRVCCAQVEIPGATERPGPSGTMNEPTPSQRWLFDTQGYLLLPDVLSREECATLIRCAPPFRARPSLPDALQHS